MKEYIEREAVLRPFIIDKNGNRIREVDIDNWEVSISIRQVKQIIREIPAADVVDRNRGRCKFCGGNDNTFHIINAETAAYSGIELSINRQGMLRVRVYDDYECETALPRSSEIIMIAACPNCGADMREVDHAET